MNETIECYRCGQQGLLLLDQLAVEHGRSVRQRCPLPPRDITHPDRQQRAHTTGTSRWVMAGRR